MAILLTRPANRAGTRLEETVFARIRQNDIDSFVYVVPTKRKLRDLQRECYRALPSRTGPPLRLFTLETLAAGLLALHVPPRFHVSGPTLAVLLQNALEHVADQLHYFRPRGPHAWLPRGTFQKIVDVITTLKEYGIYPAAMFAELDAVPGSEQSKIHDILTIYTEYERLLGETAIDLPGVLKALNDSWDPVRSPMLFLGRFQGVQDLLISGFAEFKDPELTFVGNLSSVSGLQTAVQFDYHTGNEALFGHLRENYEKFLAMGFSRFQAPRKTRSSFQEHIAATLFNPSTTVKRLEPARTVTVLHARNRHEEVELIAKLIKHIRRNEPGRELSSICISMFRPQVYTSLIRETFGRFGIPANITDRYALDQSPVIVSILALLAVRQNNYQLRDIMKALSGPFFRLESPGGQVNAGNLHAVAVRLKIKGGLAAWRNRLRTHLAELEEDLRSTIDPEELRGLERDRDTALRAQNDLGCLEQLLSRFDGPLTPSAFKAQLLRMFDDLRMTSRLLEHPPEEIGADTLEKDVRAYQQFLAFLDQFVVMLDMQGRSASAEPLQFYLDQLRTALAHVRYNIRQRYGEGVLVTSFEETRDLRFDIMIVAGMVDGDFPPLYQPEIFLTPSRRERAEKYHLTEHRYLFYQAITNHLSHLYLTVPAADGEVELVPSTFLDALRESVAVEEFRDQPPEWVRDTVYTVDDVLLLASRQDGVEVPVNELGSTLRDEIVALLERIRLAREVEDLRGDPGSASEFNGILREEPGTESRAALERMRMNVYSVTQLESYGRCPFQFFAKHILRLNAVRELDEGVTPLERGSVIHEVLFRFYVDRRERGLPSIAGCTDDEFRQAVTDITSIASSIIDAMDVPDLLWSIERERVTGSAERTGMFEEYLAIEREQPDVVRPSFFEVGFGSPARKLQSMDPRLRHADPIPAGGVLLRGKIDRIDVGGGKFTITDYKSGSSVASMKEIRSGVSLQLPVYLYAVEHILRSEIGGTLNGVGGFYVSFSPHVERKPGVASKEHAGKIFSTRSRSAVVPTDNDLRAIIDAAVEYVNAYVGKISDGRFPVDPADPKTCTHCDFKPSCRIQSRSILPDEETD